MYPVESQKTITDWAVSTFGKPNSLMDIYNRAADEFKELGEAIEMGGNNINISEEVADVFIVLYQLGELLDADIDKAITAKMRVNRNRKWKVTGDGVGSHVKDE